MDDEWPRRAANSFKKLWVELKATRRAEELAKDALHEAMVITDQAMNAKFAMQAEVQNVKRVARRVCLAYKKKALEFAMDKSKLVYLTYCLFVLVVALMFLLVLKRMSSA